MTTFSQKPADVVKKWILIDAEGLVVGRLATVIRPIIFAASTSRPSPRNVDDGDNVISSMRQGGVHRQEVHRQGLLLATGPTPAASRSARGPVLEVVSPSVSSRRPLSAWSRWPRSGRRQMKNLRVYARREHPHVAQQPSFSMWPREFQEQKAHKMAELSSLAELGAATGNTNTSRQPPSTSRNSTSRARLCHGKQRIARVWSGRLGQDRRQRKGFATYFARPVLADDPSPADHRANRSGQYDIVPPSSRRPLGPPARAPRHLQGG